LSVSGPHNSLIEHGSVGQPDIREKENTCGGHIPIVAMSAHAFKEDEKRCHDAGMDAYISKPIDFRACLQLIGDNLKKASFTSVIT